MLARYPRPLIDRLLQEHGVGAGDLVVDAGCEVADEAAACGALVLAVDEARAMSSARGPALSDLVHRAEGDVEELDAVVARELAGDLRPRLVAFGSSLLFHDRDAVLDACERCGADAVTLVIGRPTPTEWRAFVADMIWRFARPGADRLPLSREAPAAALARSSFRRMSTWSTTAVVERTIADVADLAARQALRGGILRVDAAEVRARIAGELARHYGDPIVADVRFTVVNGRRADEERLPAYVTARGA